jgi:hypothetical protein
LSLTLTILYPNIVVHDIEPWAVFDPVGKTIEVVPASGNIRSTINNPMPFRVVSRRVHCAGIGMDRRLLVEHFLQHGPYYGVYGIVDDDISCSGSITVG